MGNVPARFCALAVRDSMATSELRIVEGAQLPQLVADSGGLLSGGHVRSGWAALGRSAPVVERFRFLDSLIRFEWP